MILFSVLGFFKNWIVQELEDGECICPICQKQYKNRNTLKSHMIQDCQNRELLCCSVCGYKCKRNYHLKVHMNVRHGIAIQIKNRKPYNYSRS